MPVYKNGGAWRIWQPLSPVAKLATSSFLRYTGKTPKEYYLDARLELALSLLKQEGNTVGQVADILNFFDSFHFSKAFKHKFGYAPSAVLKHADRHPEDAGQLG